eukprot:TRINITY_DN28752_c0_g2_i2.p1 TRINITY_DN28752_c0_g2~~TRINITY_DN28752_c0_g2_i2.p1  ORF type:complete len:402 (+),score=150.52 TRINITY_DN28752_c0_g2_i2:105-1310(+)
MLRVLQLLAVSLVLLPGPCETFPLGESLRVNGRKIALTSGVDKALCRAVIEEMVGEVQKHDLKKGGSESDIFDTAGLAICLGVVNTHIMEQRRKSGKWAVRRKTTTEREAHEHGEVTSENDMEGMLLLKEACASFCDELQQEISEAIFKHVDTKTHGEISDRFCDTATRAKVKPKQKRSSKPKAKPQPSQQNADSRSAGGAGHAGKEGDISPDAFDAFMKTMNGDNSISEMIRRDRDSPELALPEADQMYIAGGVAALQCDICKHAVKRVAGLTAALHDSSNEAAIIEIVDATFLGPPRAETLADESDASLDYKPGNPPGWSQDYAVAFSAKKKKWSLQHRGDHAYDEYSDTVKRNVIFAKACRAAYDGNDMDLPEAIVLHNLKKEPWLEKLTGSFCAPAC